MSENSDIIPGQVSRGRVYMTDGVRNAFQFLDRIKG